MATKSAFASPLVVASEPAQRRPAHPRIRERMTRAFVSDANLRGSAGGSTAVRLAVASMEDAPRELAPDIRGRSSRDSPSDMESPPQRHTVVSECLLLYAEYLLAMMMDELSGSLF